MWVPVNIPFGYSLNYCYIFLPSFFLICTEISKSWSPIWTRCCRGPCKISLADFQVSFILCKTKVSAFLLLPVAAIFVTWPWLPLCKMSHSLGCKAQPKVKFVWAGRLGKATFLQMSCCQNLKKTTVSGPKLPFRCCTGCGVNVVH